MNSSAIKRPLIAQGWLRVLLFCIFYFAVIILTEKPTIFLIRLIKNDAAADINSLVNGEFLWLSLLISLIIAFVAVFLFRKLIDRKSFVSLGFDMTGYAADALSGLLLSFVILGTGSLILFFSKHLQWIDITFNGPDLFIAFGMMLMVAFSEEVVFRGYILDNLMGSFNKWIALFISAVLFTLFHTDNPNINVIPLVNIFLAGILLGINYVYTKNLWFAILFHLGWNFFQGPLLGFKVSGINLTTLLQTGLKGDLLLTGGDFGFEGSIFDTALTIIAILLLYGVYEKKYKPSAQVA